MSSSGVCAVCGTSRWDAPPGALCVASCGPRPRLGLSCWGRGLCGTWVSQLEGGGRQLLVPGRSAAAQSLGPSFRFRVTSVVRLGAEDAVRGQRTAGSGGLSPRSSFPLAAAPRPALLVACSVTAFLVATPMVPVLAPPPSPHRLPWVQPAPGPASLGLDSAWEVG